MGLDSCSENFVVHFNNLLYLYLVDIKTVNPPTTEQAQTFESKTAALGGTGQRSTTSAGVKNFNFNVRHLATFLFVDFLLFSINVNMQKISIL